jgi:hypothetical protein
MDERTCVESLRSGAADYLLKDRLARLGTAVEQALTRNRLETEARRARLEERVTMGILRGLVANAPAAICVESTEGRRLLSNPSYDRLGEPGAGGAAGAEAGRGAAGESPSRRRHGGGEIRGAHLPLGAVSGGQRVGEVFARGSIHPTSPGRSAWRRIFGPPGRNCRSAPMICVPAT